MPNKIEEVPFLHICACYLTQDILFLSQENINIYFRRRIIYYPIPKVTFHVYLHFDKIPLTEKYFHILFFKYQEFLIFFYYLTVHTFLYTSYYNKNTFYRSNENADTENRRKFRNKCYLRYANKYIMFLNGALILLAQHVTINFFIT